MKRILKLLIVSALVFSLAATTLFLAVNSGHECHIDGCQTCIRIEAALHVLKNVLAVLAVLLSAEFVIRKRKERTGAPARERAITASPMVLRVKLND